MDGMADAKRIDVISDTHGYLSDELLAALEGADLIIHAGDMTSEADWDHLNTIAPIKAVLGNNDYYRDYGPGVPALNTFTYEGLNFAVAHYQMCIRDRLIPTFRTKHRNLPSQSAIRG